jgi:hypothetical protein
MISIWRSPGVSITFTEKGLVTTFRVFLERGNLGISLGTRSGAEILQPHIEEHILQTAIATFFGNELILVLKLALKRVLISSEKL